MKVCLGSAYFVEIENFLLNGQLCYFTYYKDLKSQFCSTKTVCLIMTHITRDLFAFKPYFKSTHIEMYYINILSSFLK